MKTTRPGSQAKSRGNKSKIVTVAIRLGGRSQHGEKALIHWLLKRRGQPLVQAAIQILKDQAIAEAREVLRERHGYPLNNLSVMSVNELIDALENPSTATERAGSGVALRTPTMSVNMPSKAVVSDHSMDDL